MPRTRVETRAGRACCRRSTRGTSAASSDLDRVATQIWDDLSVPPDERRLAGLLVRTLLEHGRELDRELAEVTTNWRLERLGRRRSLRAAPWRRRVAARRDAAARRDSGSRAPRRAVRNAQEREVRQRRARRARTTHGTDVVRVLLVNWQDRENPAGGRRRDSSARDLRAARREGTRGAPALRRLARAARRARVSMASRSIASGRRHTFPFLARRALRRGTSTVGPTFSSRTSTKSRSTRRAGARIERSSRSCRICSASTAFQESRGAARGGGVAAERPLGRMYAHVPFQAISESTADDLAHRGITARVGQGHLSWHRHCRIHAESGGALADAGVRLPRPAQEVQGRASRDSRLRRVARPDARLEIAGAGDYRPDAGSTRALA